MTLLLSAAVFCLFHLSHGFIAPGVAPEEFSACNPVKVLVSINYPPPLLHAIAYFI